MAIGTQIGFAIGGVAPTAAAAIDGGGTGGWVPVACYVFGSSVLAAAAIFTARETCHLTLPELDAVAEAERAPAVAPQLREREPAGVA